jgi:hypothetical protein
MSAAEQIQILLGVMVYGGTGGQGMSKITYKRKRIPWGLLCYYGNEETFHPPRARLSSSESTWLIVFSMRNLFPSIHEASRMLHSVGCRMVRMEATLSAPFSLTVPRTYEEEEDTLLDVATLSAPSSSALHYRLHSLLLGGGGGGLKRSELETRGRWEQP